MTIDALDQLKYLSGIGQGVYNHRVETPASVQKNLAADLRRIERERNIKPGTDAWFKLWFAKPGLTGEKPYDESQ